MESGLTDSPRRSIIGRAPWADQEPSGSGGAFDPTEFTGTERAVIVARHFLAGGTLTARQCAMLTGLSESGARCLLRTMSRVLPIYDDANVWRMVDE